MDDAYTIDSGEVLQEDHSCANNNLRSSIIPCRPGVEEMHGSDDTKSDLKTIQEIKGESNATSEAMNSKGKGEVKKEVTVYGGLRLASLEESLDSRLRNKMDVIRSEQYRKISVKEGKEFNLGYALKSSKEKYIQELLAEYLDIFAWNHRDITGVNPELGELRIDLMVGAKAIRQSQHTMNPKYSLMVKDEIDRLLDAGYIYPVLNSEWVSPLVVVPKEPGPDGTPKI